MPGAIHDSLSLISGATMKVDAAIIGSGAGGSAVAAELTKQGLSVAILEEGRSFGLADLITKPSWAYSNLYVGRGVLIGKGNLMMPMAAGRAVGGSTFVNSAICFRAPDAVLNEWMREHGSTWSPERMAPLFDEIWSALEIAKTPPEIARNNSLVFKRGADKLGLGGDFISRNAPGCVGCGVCQLGCPTGGKGSTDKNLIPASIDRGANLYSEVAARELIVERGSIRGVDCAILDRATRAQTGSLKVEAKKVFLCGGAFGSPQLLQRNRLCSSSGQLGENLHIHPGQACAALFDEEIHYWSGVTQGYYVHVEGGILETFTATPELFWASIPLGQMSMGKLKNLATAGCMIRDQSQGSIKFQGDGELPAIRYEVCDNDRKAFIQGARAASRIYFAAGAKAVWPLLNAATDQVFNEGDALAALPDDLPVNRLSPYGSHPQSTCKMSGDKKSGVCKPTGETWDVENLYVADGSLFPTALGVNPQVTIMAMATGIAREVAKRG
jgi:choline dehydrogenase-like flavoprotein